MIVENRISRKWMLTLMILWIGTFMCFVPPIVSVLIFHLPAIVIISGSEWLGIVAIISGIYHVSNVMQTKIENAANTIVNKITPEDKKEEIGEK